MKPLLTFLLIAVCILCSSQNDVPDYSFLKPTKKDTAVRYCRVNKDSFKVVYAYGDDGFDDLVGIMIFEKSCPYSFTDMLKDSTKNCKRDTAAENKYYAEHNMHHYSDIFVYKIDDKGKTIQSYPVFGGLYVIAGCYEDYPPALVQRALDLQADIDKNERLKKENGEYAVYKYVLKWTEMKTGLDSGGLTITEIPMERDFLTAKEAHEFCDSKLARIFDGGVDWKFDSVLIEKIFIKPLTSEEYGRIDQSTQAYRDAMDKKYPKSKSKQ